MRRAIAYACASLTAAVLLGGCELQEITTAQAEDVVIVEMVLRGGDSIQTAYLHRTASALTSGTVPGATVAVTDPSGAQLFLKPAADTTCLRSAPEAGDLGGSCYAARVVPTFIRPGARYRLRIDLPDHRVMTGVTDVPGDFTITKPSTPAGATRTSCQLPAGTSFDITWTRSVGASVYLTESRLRNLRQALRAAGTNVEGDNAVELSGLSVSAADTTQRFPGDLGLFDRFDDDVIDILLAIRGGLPPDVDGTVVIAAADRNYVNWVRGGNFNPSGQVHISSISGDGAGVFGSIVSRTVLIATKASTRQQCIQ